MLFIKLGRNKAIPKAQYIQDLFFIWQHVHDILHLSGIFCLYHEVIYNMLQKLILNNYRCFSDSEICFKKISIFVGSNNAGKSTIIEALRIIATVCQRFRNASYSVAPPRLNLPWGTKGFVVNLESLKIDLRTIVHQYQSEVNATITAQFDNNVQIIVRLSPDLVFASISVNGTYISKRVETQRVGELHLFIMPQLGLIREEEPRLTMETIKKDMSTRLSSRHFRNELLAYRDLHFETFKALAQSTWPGLRINELIYEAEEDHVKLFVYDANYAAEIGLMGRGLQMWLQIIWFISRCSALDTIVLDEPDVYMHPDMQLKILKLVRNRFNQVVIATHSVEIISGVEPNQIITVDRTTRKMQYSASLRAVQEVISNLGSDYNLSLARLGNAKKCVLSKGRTLRHYLESKI